MKKRFLILLSKNLKDGHFRIDKPQEVTVQRLTLGNSVLFWAFAILPAFFYYSKDKIRTTQGS